MNYKIIIDWVIARMAEPTTWRGLIGIAAAAGVAISPHQSAIILALGMGLAGFINVVIKDPKAEAISAAVEHVIIPVAEAVAAKDETPAKVEAPKKK